MFLAAEPYTHDAGNNTSELQWCGSAELGYKLIYYLGKTHLLLFRITVTLERPKVSNAFVCTKPRTDLVPLPISRALPHQEM